MREPRAVIYFVEQGCSGREQRIEDALSSVLMPRTGGFPTV